MSPGSSRRGWNACRCAGSALAVDESVAQSDHPKILRLSRPAVDAAWLEEELAELARLADEGDTLEVVAKLGAIVKEPQRERVATAMPGDRPSTEVSPRTADEPSPSA